MHKRIYFLSPAAAALSGGLPSNISLLTTEIWPTSSAVRDPSISLYRFDTRWTHPMTKVATFSAASFVKCRVSSCVICWSVMPAA
mmetsp:Transcript_33785/g.75901  ORF Transcript_33785/g.75901 Transcript_33785/m.75901 type:complete len:85 (+) Transcript_33785:2-256(+)